jgi:hypothetical protein
MRLPNFLEKLLLYPLPWRFLFMRVIAARMRLGDLDTRALLGAVEYPAYAFSMYHAALLAKQLGHSAVTVVEFGVAGGKGLLAMERAAGEIEKLVPVRFHIYGFDNEKGLPPSKDPRDMPYWWQTGFFRCDRDRLLLRLDRAKVIWGDIRETILEFTNSIPAPLAMISYDLDYYSATLAALRIFDSPTSARLPRIFCYFDDIFDGLPFARLNGEPLAGFHSDWTGERLAIREFNCSSESKKISKFHLPIRASVLAPWVDKVFVLHDFGHPDYCKFTGNPNDQLPLV